jgi:recombinational DNA repair ATPase RecF
MIQLEAAYIEELRGIKSLDITFDRNPFAISGPNGSGKSGVIDAIEFGLTGSIGRLSGRGTKGLSLAEHGPHVDKTRFPDAAFVRLKVFIPELGRSATITRRISAPNKPRIEPDEPEIRAALAQVADHPEIALSRKEVLRFILIEPSKRSEEIQTILKLEDIGQMRAALNSAQNKLQLAHRTASAVVQAAAAALQRHLQIAELSAEGIRTEVNQRRRLLGLAELSQIGPGVRVDEGLAATSAAVQFNKESMLRDLVAASEAAKRLGLVAKDEIASIIRDVELLNDDQELLSALQSETFFEKGLELVQSEACPLCDAAWESIDTLKAHIRAKLDKSDEAKKLQRSLLLAATAVSSAVVGLAGVVSAVHRAAEANGDAAFAGVLRAWIADLDEFRAKLGNVETIVKLENRLRSDWLQAPVSLAQDLAKLIEKVSARPDQSATISAQSFLTTSQVRLSDYREARLKKALAARSHELASHAYELYCEVLEAELTSLYSEVEADFSAYYREINQDDEATFTAKLTPSEGKLDLQVNFYERGLFPPAAYHSEGHQDGMGVCLYLALMKRLLGSRFTFALLDDVVMSVDADHRYEFCKLLKTRFPDTQFVITTHDRLWAEQMRSAGLVTRKTSMAFHGWTVDTGPLVESAEEIWSDIERALARGKTDVAAAALRRHLEFVSRLVCDQLGAPVAFRADGGYELGELLPGVLKRLRELYSKAAEAAQSWGDQDTKAEVIERKTALSGSNAAINVDQWAVNKAVHYNEWANFGRRDFEPVVAAFKALLECMRCAKCDSWLYVAPRARPEALRCSCNAVSLNLKAKE